MLVLVEGNRVRLGWDRLAIIRRLKDMYMAAY